MTSDSIEKKWPSGLYLIPSPLGNLGDLTLRVIEALGAADLVAAEDTRRSLKLLNHLGLKKPLISYREENHQKIWPRIESALKDGARVALLSDAGAPAVSDPGAMAASQAAAAGFNVYPLAGPSAVITALMGAGFGANAFTFGGFLPPKSGERRRAAQALASLPHTLVFFEAPHRLAASLKDLSEVLGPRRAVVAREMTKLHEEFIRGTLPELAALAVAKTYQGEMTLVIEAPATKPAALELDVDQVTALAQSDPRPTKVLAAELARELGRSRAELYELIVKARGASDR